MSKFKQHILQLFKWQRIKRKNDFGMTIDGLISVFVRDGKYRDRYSPCIQDTLDALVKDGLLVSEKCKWTGWTFYKLNY